MSVSYDDRRVWKNIHHDLKDELLVRIVNSLECSICSEVMHVPFLAGCGHSFCYGCLDAWFDTKVNCPTCRKDMNEPPTLNIQLRDISKSATDLVIDTLEDEVHKKELHDARKRLIDEFEQATKSKGLFREAFNSAPTLVDRSDGVPRCGNCHWEAHGSVCLQCGARFRTPHGDSYYDSDDGDAYNEDQEEVELYGVAHTNYDSEDSFVDNRDMYEINNDREDSDGILSSGDNESGVESWDGFRRDSEMFRGGDDEGSRFAAEVNVASGSELENEEHDEYNDARQYYDDQADEDPASDWDGQYNKAMENAVHSLHDQDVEDYATQHVTDLDEGSDSDWGTSVATGRRTVHIIDSDDDY